MKTFVNFYLITALIFLLLSVNAYSQWQNVTPPDDPLSVIEANGVLYAGSYDYVYHSTNEGTSWMQGGLINESISVLIANGNNIFAGCLDGIYRSTDQGTNWLHLTNGIGSSFVYVNCFFTIGGTIFAGIGGNSSGSQKPIYYSTDGGDSWSQRSVGITGTNIGAFQITSIGGTLFTAVRGNFGQYADLYKSTDMGANWTEISVSPSIGCPDQALITAGSELYGSFSSGIYKSNDEGSTWIPNESGIPEFYISYDFAISDGYIYTGLYEYGVYRKTTTGSNWTEFNDGLPSGRDVEKLSTGSNYIYCITTYPTAGLYRYSRAVGINPISSEIPAGFSLSQNYPNPFNPMTKIKFDIPKAFNTKLAVYDILGKEVAVLVNDNLRPGTYEIDFNAADLPSGTYFYRLETDGISETKKMLLIK